MAGFELGDAVEAFGAGVGHPGQDGGDDLVLPAGDGGGERNQLGDLLVLGAPVVEGKEPVPDLAFAGDRAGDAAAEVQGAAEFLLPVQARAGGITRFLLLSHGEKPRPPARGTSRPAGTRSRWDRCHRTGI